MKCATLLLFFGATASTATAQGALSTGGLGYPPGQTSARSEGAGGSLADFDPLSLVSPAAIAGVGASALYFQYSPEFRRVTVGPNTAKTTTARFPLVSGVMPIGQHWTAALSSSTFLDRSYETSVVRREAVGTLTDSTDVTEENKVLGAINDVRLALGWARSATFRFGVGGHVFAGSNRVTISEVFPDSSKFLGSTQNARISYAGFAASVGLEYHPSTTLAFAVAGRKGGDLRAETADTLIGTGRIPDHYSASVSYTGISGATLALRAAHDSWSSLSSLSSTGIQAFDGWDMSGGAEVTGPRLLQRVIFVRAGARHRTLPFGFNGQKVSETSFMAGLGAPLARDRASIDINFQHAARSADASVKETGYIFSFGLRVTP
ncbi:MAG TPA: hypothetical protein VHL12_01525 [Gemmatimonadaceae bacterium]|nr:hypothetical protein [Gemmatimonadaceae bacterium]